MLGYLFLVILLLLLHCDLGFYYHNIGAAGYSIGISVFHCQCRGLTRLISSMVERAIDKHIVVLTL
jgi:hypothetical protein